VKTISAADIARLASHRDFVEALRSGFAGDIVSPLRHHHELPRAGADPCKFLMMPSWTDMSRRGPKDAFVGLKTVMVVPDNGRRDLPTVQAGYQLFSGETGEILALIDGRELTARRTACASALAADYLARADAARLTLIGAGVVGAHLVYAHAAVRPIRTVRIYNRSRDKAEALAASLSRDGFEATAPSIPLAESIAWADIVSSATTSTEPVIHGQWLKDGVHVDVMGAFKPTMREVDGDAVERASVFVDTREGALAEAGDIVLAIKEGRLSPERIAADLKDLCGGRHRGRSSDHEITLFKSSGTALEDLACAIMLHERA
jgi:ornithine cyclodeaminase/alanine dehydrogenase-like protein (mu-crystallin family)